ncbi:hypothetical protein [Bacillus licheniformis]|uniref:hypothetical protein n=1 Tax=Bacillus licheniformis TaxID=1402 RepID=UPI0030C9F73B
MVLLLTILFLMTLLGIDIPWGEIIRLVSSILNSKFITSAITSWPLAIVIIAFAFKKGILDILKGRKITVSGGGGNGLLFSIGEKLETVEDNLNEAPKKVAKDDKTLIDIPKLTMKNDNERLISVINTALLNPVEAIENVGRLFLIDLERILTFVEDNTNLKFEGDILRVMDVLYENRNVSKQAADAIKGLFIIFRTANRDSTKYNMDRTKYANEVRDYYLLCVNALEQLRSELSETLVKDLQS